MRKFFLVLSVVIASSTTMSCSTSPSRAAESSVASGRLRALVQTDQPIVVTSGARPVRLEPGDAETSRLTIGGAVFHFLGHARYVADLGSNSGWVRVGKVHFEYAGDQARVKTRKVWRTVTFSDDSRFFIRPDGTVGRSVFK